MERWQLVALAVVALVLLLSLLQFVLALVSPKVRSPLAPDALGLPYEDVRIETADGLALAAWWVPAANATDRTLVVGHGYPADKGDVLPGAAFLHERFNLLFFDHRSFGESEGRVSTLGLREVRDVHAVVAYALNETPTRHLGAFGFSFSASTMLLAREAAFEALVADSGFASLDRLVPEVFPYAPGPLKWPFVWTTSLYARVFLGAWPGEIDATAAIAETRALVLIIHGTADAVIPVEHARALHGAAPEGVAELWLVEGAGHGETHAVAGRAYEERVLAFFDAHLGRP